MSETVTKTEEETKKVENEAGAKAQNVKKSSFKVSPLYEGDTTVDLTDPFYSESNINHLLRGIAALNAGKGVEHDLIEDN